MSKYPGAEAFIDIIGLISNEKVVIFTDRNVSFEPLEILKNSFQKIGAHTDIIGSLPLSFADELSEEFESFAKDADVCIFAASQSWYHTTLRKNAKYNWKKRVVECYGLVTESLLEGGMTADYKLVAEVGRKMVDSFHGKTMIKIVSEKGTDIKCNFLNSGYESGQYQKAGAGGNLPAGEVFILPEPESVEGRVVIDISMDLLNALNEDPLKIDIKKGKIVDLQGNGASVLKRIIDEDDRVSYPGEIGFGTNSWAILNRNVLEDEKRLGTAHFGFGNNSYFGGRNSGPHLDGVFWGPEIELQ